MKKYYTVSELAKITGKTKRTINYAIQNGRLKAKKVINGSPWIYHIKIQDGDEYIESCKIKTPS